MNEELRRGITDILNEMEQLWAADNIGAIQISIVKRDGEVRTMHGHDDGFRISMVGAASIALHEALRSAEDGVTRDIARLRPGDETA